MYTEAERDSRIKVFFPGVNLTMTLVDTVASANRLAANHACGMTAAIGLGEALAGVALLGGELSANDETVTLRLKTGGGVGGAVVEAGFGGLLRGYTCMKVLPASDSKPEPSASEIWGVSGSMEIIRSLPGKIISSASCDLDPVTVTEAIERYYRQSLQRVAVAETAAARRGGVLGTARGVLVECMPDGDEEAFARVHQFFEDNTIYNALMEGANAETICDIIRLPFAKIGRSEPLRFGCRCSEERVKAMLAGLPESDLQALLDECKPAEITCHMCGQHYSVGLIELVKLMNEKRSTPES